MDEKCYFCETEKDVTQKLYIYSSALTMSISRNRSACVLSVKQNMRLLFLNANKATQRRTKWNNRKNVYADIQ